MDRVILALGEPHLVDRLAQARADLMSIARAQNMEFIAPEDPLLERGLNDKISIFIQE